MVVVSYAVQNRSFAPTAMLPGGAMPETTVVGPGRAAHVAPRAHFLMSPVGNELVDQ
jgi:hypothetical protein